MKPDEPLSHKEKAVLALALSWAAGSIDALGYLLLFKAFVAHMSGNTVSVVLHAVDGQALEVLHRGVPIPAFFLGLLTGELVLEAANRRRRRRIVWRSLVIEAVCLSAFILLGFTLCGPRPGTYPHSAAVFVLMTSLAALAMGVQNASLRRVGAVTIFTTHITGTLTKLANDLAEYLFWFRDRTRGRLAQRLAPTLRLSVRQTAFQAVILLSGLYLSYALGALAGALGFRRFGPGMAAAPLALVLGAILMDLLRPIAPAP